MKKSILILVALLLSDMLMATPRTLDQARAEAESFWAAQPSNAQRAPRASELRVAHTLRTPEAAKDLAYVFTTGQNAGFVIISADDDAKTVLGYADEGTFDPAHIPSNMQVWLEHYAEEIAYAAEHKTLMLRGEQVATQRSMRAAKQTTAVSPLLGNIRWNQDAPYNNLCPMDGDGTRSYTGCVATATAQIMRFWQYPAQGTGSHSYDWYNCNNEVETLSVDFSATTYDWANMRTSYGTSYTSAQATAVATLMYHVGVASDMSYGGESIGGSGTQETLAAYALYTYFGYDAGIRAIRPDFIGQAAFESGVLAELEAGRPVMISGLTVNDEGHAFVCDGVDDQGLYHINWGWGGYSDGYFALSALDPDAQGIGGAASGAGFRVDVSAIIGIQPNQGGTASEYVEMGATSMSLTTAQRIAKSAQVRVDISGIQNLGFETFEGRIGVCVTDTLGNIQSWLDYDDVPLGFGFTPGAFISSYYRGRLNSLANGQYRLVPVFTNAAQTATYRMAMRQDPQMLPFTVTNDSIFFGEGSDEPSEDYTGKITEADIYYYPDYGNNLVLRLSSDDMVMSEGQVISGYLIDFDLYTQDPTSIVGTYILDTEDTGSPCTMGYEGSGLYLPSTGYYIKAGMVTVTMDNQGMYRVVYSIRANNTNYNDTVLLAPEHVTIYRADYNYSTDKFDWSYYSLTNSHASALSVADAIPQALRLEAGYRSQAPYLVRGIVSAFNNTPEQIAQYGTAQYYISDDGTTDNQLYCFRQHWLNDQPFTTGYEISLGDTLVIYAPTSNYQGLPELYYSYIYQAGSNASPSSLTDMDHTVGYEKIMRDGQVYIRREGDMYDLLGRKIQ